MCQECGCSEKETIQVEKHIHEANNKIAHDSWHMLKDKDIFCLNIMGGPGCGKTSFIEEISKYIPPQQIAVIQGDLESDIDKQRLEAQGIQTYQINTHSGCHLTAEMVSKAIEQMNLEDIYFLIIENVGNLVCPAGVRLGQHSNIVLSATTEGSDKPKKYPIIFHDAQLILITKYDLRKYVEFDQTRYLADVTELNKKAPILTVSTKQKESWDEVVQWLAKERQALLIHTHCH